MRTAPRERPIRRCRRRCLALALCLSSFILQPSAFSQVPLQFTYQGRLTDSNGVPVVGVVTADFAIVRGGDAMSGGTTVHVENAVSVTTDANGVFSHLLGVQTPISLSNLTDGVTSRWIQVSVDTEPLLPRQQLVSVPYALTAIGVVPPGTVLPYAGVTASIPSGWLPCDGRLTNAVDHPRLFAALQFTYGGTGSQFRLPDMRGRVPMGAGQGGGLSNRTLGQTVGAETHLLTVPEMPSHAHGGHTTGVDNQGGTDFPRDFNGPGSNLRLVYAADTLNRSSWFLAHTHGISAEGGSQPHNIVQPSLVLNYIIKD